MNTNVSLLKADLIMGLKELLRLAGYSLSYRKLPKEDSEIPVLKSRVSISKIKSLIRKRGLALTESGVPSWFYTAYHRKNLDPLTNYTMDFICKEVPKNSNVLITGCGTGIMLFYLMDQGFENVEGFDFLEECVLIANDIVKLGGYNTRIWQDDGFRPALQKKYDLITAVHWVFSAWMGNYGNNAVSLADAKSSDTRERLLVDFLSKYSPFLNPGGMLIIELTDAVADYRLPLDNGVVSTPLADIYPVRHSPEQVSMCAEKCGLKVITYNMCCSYGHQPRTSYILKKI